MSHSGQFYFLFLVMKFQTCLRLSNTHTRRSSYMCTWTYTGQCDVARGGERRGSPNKHKWTFQLDKQQPVLSNQQGRAGLLAWVSSLWRCSPLLAALTLNMDEMSVCVFSGRGEVRRRRKRRGRVDGGVQMCEQNQKKRICFFNMNFNDEFPSRPGGGCTPMSESY